MSVLETIHGLLSLAVENGASDVHIKSNKPAFLRLSGGLESVEMDPIAPDEVREFIEQSVPAEFYDIWVKNRQVDYSYSAPGCRAFPCERIFAAGLPSIVMRHVSDQPPTFQI